MKQKKYIYIIFSSYNISDMGLCECKTKTKNKEKTGPPTMTTKWMDQTWFGSSIWSEQNMVVLKEINYQLQVVNSLMNINFRASYYNSSTEFQEVIYTLPLNSESTIHEIWVEFQHFNIEGVVRQKKKEFKKAETYEKNESKKTAFKHQKSQNKNILSLTIGNVAPKTSFSIVFSLVQAMTFTINNFYKLQIPSEISPHSAYGAEKKNNKIGKIKYQWSFSISIQTSRKIEFFKSPSHLLDKVKQNQSKTELNFQLKEDQILSRNFVLLYLTEDFHLPAYTYGRNDSSSSVILSFIPRFWETNINEAYEASKKGKKILFDQKETRGEYIFFIDRGSSMKEVQMEKARETLIFLLSSLPYDSFFNIVSLGTTFKKMYEESPSNTKKKVEEAIDVINKMTANLGELYLNEPFEMLLNEEHIQGYPKHIIFLNNGSSEVSDFIMRLIQSKRKYCRVHSITFGRQASASVRQIVNNGRGECLTVYLKDKQFDKPLQFLNTILTPVVDDIAMKYDHQIVESVLPKPGENSLILKDEIVNIYFTFKAPLNKKFKLEIEYQDSVQVVPHKHYIEIDPEKMNFPFVDKFIHAKVLQALEKQSQDLVKIGGKTLFVKMSGYKEQIIRLSIQHQILSKYTAYIGQKKTGDAENKQKRDKQTIEIDQTRPTEYEELEAFKSSMEPDGALILNLNSKQQEDKIFEENQNYHSFKKTNHNIAQLQNLQNLDDENILSSIGYMSPVNSFTSINSSRSHKRRSGKGLIQRIQKSQKNDGRWNDLELIKQQQKWDKIRQILFKIDKDIVVTYLIVAWINKYKPSKKLAQQAKKGEKWIKLKIKERKVQEKQLIKLDHFV